MFINYSVCHSTKRKILILQVVLYTFTTVTVIRPDWLWYVSHVVSRIIMEMESSNMVNPL